MTSESRREIGERVYREVMCAEPPSRASLFRNIAQIDQEYAQVWSRPGLPRKDRRWIVLACLACRSALVPLRAHVRGALASGDITVEEMMEGILHFASYGGMARAESFDDLLWDVVEELGLPIPELASQRAPVWASEEERMAVAQDAYRAVIAPDPRPVPPGDVLGRWGTMGMQFPEIWARGGITRRERRIISLVCATMSGAPGPSAAHWNGALTFGDLTNDELGEFALQFAFYAGWPQAQVMPKQIQPAN